MPLALARRPHLLRPAAATDLAGLLALENQVFATDRLSRRSFRNFLDSATATLIVADEDGIAGYALTLFRPRSRIARLYSIAVAPAFAGHGTGAALLAAAESKARERGCSHMRLEVHVGNGVAIARYRAAGYRELGRRAGYYQDGGDALRFEKALYPPCLAA